MTKETKVGLVIGLLFMVAVVYLLSWFSQPSEQQRQAFYYRSEVPYQPSPDPQPQTSQPTTLSAAKQTDLLVDTLETADRQTTQLDSKGRLQDYFPHQPKKDPTVLPGLL